MEAGGIDPARTAEERALARFRRSIAVLVGIGAVIAATLAFVSSECSRRANDASATVTLNNIDAFIDLAAGGSHFQFVKDTTRRYLLLDAAAIARTNAAQDEIGTNAFDIVVKLLNVDAQTAVGLTKVQKALDPLPLAGSSLDPPMVAALQTITPRDVDPILAEAATALDESATWGNRAGRIGLALALVALAGSLIGLAGLIGPDGGGRILRATGAAGLLLAVIWAAFGFL
jgi:hypothetical protein